MLILLQEAEQLQKDEAEKGEQEKRDLEGKIEEMTSQESMLQAKVSLPTNQNVKSKCSKCGKILIVSITNYIQNHSSCRVCDVCAHTTYKDPVARFLVVCLSVSGCSVSLPGNLKHRNLGKKIMILN